MWCKELNLGPLEKQMSSLTTLSLSSSPSNVQHFMLSSFLPQGVLSCAVNNDVNNICFAFVPFILFLTALLMYNLCTTSLTYCKHEWILVSGQNVQPHLRPFTLPVCSQCQHGQGSVFCLCIFSFLDISHKWNHKIQCCCLCGWLPSLSAFIFRRLHSSSQLGICHVAHAEQNSGSSFSVSQVLGSLPLKWEHSRER